MALGLRCRVLTSAFALLSVDATTIEAQDTMGVVAKLKTAHRLAQKDSHALLRHQGGTVTPKFQTRSTDEGAAAPVSYVFLQKFPLEGTDDLLWHTEVLVCPREGFAPDEQKYLDQKIESLTDFVEIDESWWQDKTASCTELGYGGDDCTDRCCAVPHGADERDFPLNEHRAVIGNAKVEEKYLYLYGTGALEGDQTWHATCDEKCWSNWAGTDYNPLTNNCNTFTSTVLHCVFGLSEKKPDLGVSDLVNVDCAPASCDRSGSSWKQVESIESIS